MGLAGYRCVIGSRSEEKGQLAAQKATDTLTESGRIGDLTEPIEGADNATAARCDLVLVVVPYDAMEATLAPLADGLAGKTVVCCVNALGVDEDGPYPRRVAGGSAAEECQAVLPDAHVVGAFQNLSAVALRRVDQPVEADVVVTGNDASARAEVAALARGIPGVRAVVAGPLRLSAPVEDLTALLVAVNKRHKSHASVRLTGLADEAVAAAAAPEPSGRDTGEPGRERGPQGG